MMMTQRHQHFGLAPMKYPGWKLALVESDLPRESMPENGRNCGLV